MLRVAIFLAPACVACLASLFPGHAYALSYTDPASLVPVQPVLPESWGLIKLLLLLTFFIHLLLVNMLIGSCLLALISSLRKKARPGFSIREETFFLPNVLALAVNFGVAPFLFLQVLHGRFLYPSTLLMAVWWMGIAGFVMLAYYALYIVSDKAQPGTGTARPVLVLITLMLCFTAFLLSNNSTLMLRPEHWEAWLRYPMGNLLHITEPTLLPRYLHVLFASLAVGGLTIAVRAALRNKAGPGAEQGSSRDRIREGLAWFRHATLAQAAAGILFLVLLPPETRGLFLGGSAVATSALAIATLGMLLAFYLSYLERVYAVCGITAGVVLVMVGMRDMVRDSLLSPYLNMHAAVPELAQKASSMLFIDKGQRVTFVFFVIFLFLAVAVIGWMALATARALRAPGETPVPGMPGTDPRGE